MRRQTILKKAVLRAVVVGMLLLFSTSGYAIAEINQQNDIKNKATELSSRPSPHNNYNPALCNPLRRSLCNFEYYVGFDLKRRRMPYEKNLGSNIMPKVIPEYGVFVGVKFNEYFGLEFGYEWSKKVTGKKFGKAGDNILGVIVPLFYTKEHTLLYKNSGASIHAVLMSPALIKKTINFKLFVSVGIRYHKMSFYHSFKDDSPFLRTRDRTQKLISYKKIFNSPELKIGLIISPLQNRIFIRPHITFSKTSYLDTFIDDDRSDIDSYTLKHKNSTTYGCSIALKI